MVRIPRRRASPRRTLAAIPLLLACSSSSPSAGLRSADGSLPPVDAGVDVVDADDDGSPEDAPDNLVPDALPYFIDPFNGLVGCDAAYRGAFDCAGETLLHGGLEDVFYPETCSGTVGSPAVTLAGVLRGGARLTLVLTFASPIVAGAAGSLPPATVTITVTGGDAAMGSWTTPTGACAVMLDSDVCFPGTRMGDYGISGMGSCAQAAAPAAGNPAAPVDIPGFSFSAYLVAAPTDGG